MAKKTGKKKEEAMVMVGPGADEDDEREDLEEEEEETSEKEGDDDEGEDEEEESASRKKKSKGKEEDEDGDSDEDDERVGHGEDDEEETEDGKEKTRESRKARRERQKRARRRNEVELNFLRTQNEQLERKVAELGTRVDKSEAGSIDQRIASVQSQLKVADQVFAKAVKSGEEEDITEATNIRDKLKETLTRLNYAKGEMARRADEPDEPQVDSRLIHHARTWLGEHRWYDPNGTDRDSRRVAAIDDALVKEGFDPRTPEYWDELTERVEKALPHRTEDRRNGRDDDDDLEDEDRGSRGRKTQRGRGPRFSTGGRERPLRKNEVYVDPERKKALQEAGVWDDPVLRNRYLKRYAEYDRANPRGRAAR